MWLSISRRRRSCIHLVRGPRRWQSRGERSASSLREIWTLSLSNVSIESDECHARLASYTRLRARWYGIAASVYTDLHRCRGCVSPPGTRIRAVSVWWRRREKEAWTMLAQIVRRARRGQWLAGTALLAGFLALTAGPFAALPARAAGDCTV